MKIGYQLAIVAGLLNCCWLMAAPCLAAETGKSKVKTDALPVWKLTGPIPSRVDGKYSSYPVEALLLGRVEGKLVYAVEDRYHEMGNIADLKYSMDGHNNLIVIHDLGDHDQAGYATITFKPKFPSLPLNSAWSFPLTNVEYPVLSPDGRYLLFRYSAPSVYYFPSLFDFKTQEEHIMRLNDINERTGFTSEVLQWSPDSVHFAYFPPERSPNGLPLGELDIPYAARRVFVYDCNTQEHALAARAVGLTLPLTWRTGSNLIYSGMPGDEKSNLDKVDPGRPNIYEYSLDTKKTRLVMQDGYRPTASPDGSLIAFFGSRDIKDPQPLYPDETTSGLWRFFCSGASLCVAKADGSGRTPLQPYTGLYPRVQWLPDNAHFVTIELTKGGPNFEAEVTLWNAASRSRKKLVTLRATVAESFKSRNARSMTMFPFFPMGASADGKTVYVESVSQGAIDTKQGPNYRSKTEVLQGIAIDTGYATTVAVVKDAEGMDWVPSQSPSQPTGVLPLSKTGPPAVTKPLTPPGAP